MTTLVLQPDATAGKDTSIRGESGTTNQNFGITASLVVAQNGGTYPWKTLIRFDLSSIAAGSTCNSATLSLYNTDSSGSTNIAVHEVAAANSGWVEGTKDEATAGTGESCWAYRAYNTTGWAGSAGLGTSGTDYVATAIGAYTHAGSVFAENQCTLDVTTVAAWFGTTNPGILLRETSDNWEQPVYASSDYSAAYRPKLTVDYTAGGGEPPAAVASPSFRMSLLGVGF